MMSMLKMTQTQMQTHTHLLFIEFAIMNISLATPGLLAISLLEAAHVGVPMTMDGEAAWPLATRRPLFFPRLAGRKAESIVKISGAASVCS